MLVEEQHLRWCGIDMRARWRRRVAVVLTYALFLWVVWILPERMYGVLLALFYVVLFGPLLVGTLADVGPVVRWTMRAILLLVIGVYVYLAWHDFFRPRAVSLGEAGMFALTLLVSRSVVGYARLVDSPLRGWRARSVERGASLPGWRQRGLARHGFAVGLEGFAKYEFGKKFGALTQDEQDEVTALHRANPAGKWMRQRIHPLFNDERLQAEDGLVRARVHRIMICVLVGLAFVSAILLDDGCVVSAHVVVAGLWTLAAMMTTLRQAIPLWTEADPRVVGGELVVMDEARA